MTGLLEVIRKEPGKRSERITIPNTIKAMQKEVGGYIQCVYITSDVVVLCDEEGRLKEQSYCCTIKNNGFVGTVLIAGVDRDGFCSIGPDTHWLEAEIDD